MHCKKAGIKHLILMTAMKTRANTVAGMHTPKPQVDTVGVRQTPKPQAKTVDGR